MAIALSMDFGVTGVEKAKSSVKGVSTVMTENAQTVETNNQAWGRLRDTEGKFATKEQVALIHSLAQSKAAMNDTTASINQMNASMGSANTLATEQENFAVAAAELGFASQQSSSMFAGLDTSITATIDTIRFAKDSFTGFILTLDELSKVSNIKALVFFLEILEETLSSMDFGKFQNIADFVTDMLDSIGLELTKITMVLSALGVNDGLIAWTQENASSLYMLYKAYLHMDLISVILGATMVAMAIKASGVGAAFMKAAKESNVFALAFRDLRNEAKILFATMQKQIPLLEMYASQMRAVFSGFSLSGLLTNARQTLTFLNQLMIMEAGLTVRRMEQAFNKINLSGLATKIAQEIDDVLFEAMINVEVQMIRVLTVLENITGTQIRTIIKALSVDFFNFGMVLSKMAGINPLEVTVQEVIVLKKVLKAVGLDSYFESLARVYGKVDNAFGRMFVTMIDKIKSLGNGLATLLPRARQFWGGLANLGEMSGELFTKQEMYIMQSDEMVQSLNRYGQSAKNLLREVYQDQPPMKVNFEGVKVQLVKLSELATKTKIAISGVMGSFFENAPIYMEQFRATIQRGFQSTVATMGPIWEGALSRMRAGGDIFASFRSSGIATFNALMPVVNNFASTLSSVFQADTMQAARTFVNIFTAESFKGVITNLSTMKNGLQAVANDGKVVGGIFRHIIQPTGILHAIESIGFLSAGLAGLGSALLQSDKLTLKFLGTIAILGAILTGGLLTVIQMGLSAIGNAIASVGQKMSDVMSTWVDKFQKAQVAVVNFKFTVEAMGKSFGKATAGSLESWEGFIEGMEKNSIWDVTSLQKMVQEIVSVGSALKMTNGQQEMLARMVVDHAKAGEDLFDVTVAFVQGLNGMGQGLIKYGLHASDTAVEHSKFAKEIGKSLSEMNDYEKSQARLGTLLEQTIKIEGKHKLQLQTMAGSLAMVDKATGRLAIAMGEQGYFTMLYYKTIATLIDTFTRVPPVVLTVTSTLWDLFSILLQVGGKWLANALMVSAIIMAFKTLSYILSSVVIVQTALNFTFGFLTTQLGVQAVAVTGLSSVWMNLALILKGVLALSFKVILGMLAESVVRIKAVSVAIMTSPIFWKIMLIVGAVIALYNGFKRLEERTKVFSKFVEGLTRSFAGLGASIKDTADEMTTMEKVIMVGTVLFESAAEAAAFFISILVSGAIGAVLFFTKQLELMMWAMGEVRKAFGITVKSLDEAYDAISAFNTNAEETINLLSNDMSQTLSSVTQGVDRFGSAYASAQSDQQSFADGVEAISKALKINNDLLEKAKKHVEELKDAQAEAGDGMAAKFLGKEVIGAEKEVAKVQATEGAIRQDDKQVKDAGVTIKDLNKQELKAKQEIAGAIKDLEQTTLELTVNAQVKVMLEKGQFKEAMALELKTNKEILDLQDQLVKMEPFKDKDAQALQAYQAMGAQIGQLQNQIQAKFLAAEKEFADKKLQVDREYQKKKADTFGDWFLKLQIQRDEDMESVQKNLDQGLINFQKAEEAKALIEKKFRDEALKQQQDANIKNLEEQVKINEAAGKKDPQLEMEVKQQKVQKEMPNATEAEQLKITDNQLVERDLAMLLDMVGKYFGNIRTTIANELDMPPPQQVFDALAEMAAGFYKVGIGMEGAQASVDEGQKKFLNEMDLFSKSVQKNAAEFREKGAIVDAEQLEEKWKGYENKVAQEILPKMKEFVAQIMSQSAMAQGKAAETFEKVPAAIQENLVKPLKKGLTDVSTITDETIKKVSEGAEELTSVFDEIDMQSIEGFTKATGSFLENFGKISPGKVMGELFKKMFKGSAIAGPAKVALAAAQLDIAKAWSDKKPWEFLKATFNAGWSALLLSLSNVQVWETIFTFFNVDEKEFKAKMAEKIMEFMRVFQRLAENLPTLILSITTQIGPMIVSALVGVASLSLNLVALAPVLMTRIFTEAAKSVSKFPQMLLDAINQGLKNIAYGAEELYYGFYHVFSNLMSGVVRLVITWLGVIFLTVRKMIKDQMAGVFQQISNVTTGMADLLISSAVEFQSKASFDTAPIVGGLKIFAGAMATTVAIVNKMPWDDVVKGVMDMTVGMSIALASQSEQATEWAYGIIVATTLVKATMALLNKDMVGAASIFVTGMAQATAVVEAYNKRAGDKMQDKFEAAQRRSQDWMAQAQALEEKNKALEREIKDTGKVGGDEFKIKDVEDRAEVSLKDYSLNAVQAIKDQWQSGAEGFMDAQKLEVGPPDALTSLKGISDQLGGTATTILVAAIALGIALWPIAATGVIIGAIVLAIAGLVYLIIEYWKDISKFFEWIGDAMAEWATALGDWLVDLGQAMIQAGIDLFNYITSGQMFVDIWAMITSVVTELGRIFTVIGDGVKAAFQWVYDTLLAPVIKAFSDAFQWVYDTFLAPMIAWFDGSFVPKLDELAGKLMSWLGEMLTSFDSAVLQPLGDAFMSGGQWLWDNIFAPFFVGVTDTFYAIFDAIDATVLQPIKSFFDGIGASIRAMGDAIANIIKKPLEWFVSAVKAPFVWIYDNIIKPIINFNPVKQAGKGIASVGDSIAGFFGWAHGGMIPAYAHGGAIAQTKTFWRAANGMRVPGMAGGGDSYGRDTVPAMLSPGEVVLPNSVAQNGNLMRDIGRLISGESVPTGAVTNITASESTTNNSFTINVNVSGNARMTRQDVEREILPAIMDGIKEASQRGRPVLSQKGVFQ